MIGIRYCYHPILKMLSFDLILKASETTIMLVINICSCRYTFLIWKRYQKYTIK